MSRAAAAFAALLLLLGVGCDRKRPAAPPQRGATTVIDPALAVSAPQLTASPMRFSDVTAQAGVDWRYSNGAAGAHLFIETTGGGVAWLDYDRDGFTDLFAVQGGAVPAAPRVANGRGNVLYRNNGDGTFKNVTAGSGLDVDTGYGQGVSVADFDDDGLPDLYITAYGGNRLFRNSGSGRFKDVTDRAGVADLGSPKPWPLSSAWGDYDGDGRLDLFVCHYVKWSPETNLPCRDPAQKLSYCRPQVYEGSPSRLYRNNGDGTFTDVSARSGVAALAGKSMGAAWIDADEDGRLDLFVTNDTSPNFLLRNNGDGTFTDRALTSGVAVGATGSPMSGMGIGVGDYDGDGRIDLLDVNFAGEPKGVWRNSGRGVFENRSFASNLASTNLQFLGFGMEAADYDLDGRLDLIIGNGHVLDDPSSLGEGTTVAQSQQLFLNRGDGVFAEDLRSLGDLVHPRITRGLATADYDNDGDLDIAMVAQNGPLQLFRNDGDASRTWISFLLEGDRANRDAVGARIRIKTKSGALTSWVQGGSSYCSASDRRVVFGLAGKTDPVDVEVTWPDGEAQEARSLAPGRLYHWRRKKSPEAVRP